MHPDSQEADSQVQGWSLCHTAWDGAGQPVLPRPLPKPLPFQRAALDPTCDTFVCYTSKNIPWFSIADRQVPGAGSRGNKSSHWMSLRLDCVLFLTICNFFVSIVSFPPSIFQMLFKTHGDQLKFLTVKLIYSSGLYSMWPWKRCLLCLFSKMKPILFMMVSSSILTDVNKTAYN